MAEKRATIQPIEDLDPSDFIAELYDANDPAMATDPLIQIIKHLYETINTLINHTNTNNGQVDRMTMTSDVNIDTLVSNVSTNNAKVGITSSQASAITANTAKTGITSSQASAITANTARGNSFHDIKTYNFTASTDGKIYFLPIKGTLSPTRALMDEKAPFDATIFDIAGFAAPLDGTILRVALDFTQAQANPIEFILWEVTAGTQRTSDVCAITFTPDNGDNGNRTIIFDVEQGKTNIGGNLKVAGKPALSAGRKYMFSLTFKTAPDDIAVTIHTKYDLT